MLTGGSLFPGSLMDLCRLIDLDSPRHPVLVVICKSVIDFYTALKYIVVVEQRCSSNDAGVGWIR